MVTIRERSSETVTTRERSPEKPRRIPLIMVIGSLNMDLVAYVPHHPLPGETLTADHFATSPGGKGANQAVACSKLSRRRDVSDLVEDPGPAAYVAMVGCVGKDDYGARLKQSLCDYGVHVHGVERREGVQTGVALIIVDGPTGENRIVLHPGANHALLPADLAMRIELDVNEDSLREGQDWRVPDLFILQLEIPFETVLAVLRIAGRARDVLLNPAPARKLPDAVYDGLAHLVLNETEAAILGEVEQASLDDEKGLQTVAERFVDKGVRNVIITLGGRGAYYMSSDGRKGLVPAEKAKVVDTTAAGDTFVGQYALEVVGKQQTEIDIEAAVRKANRAAAKTVERAGAQDSIPWREELE